MLRRIRVGLLAAANASGLSRLIGTSGWRQNRLLILCYHGISDSDLHQWNPSMFMHAEEFRRRLKFLRDAKCHVLGLGEALMRLENETLPPRSVVLTFDDGFADFHRLTWPMLREFGCPATLYLTTYYMLRNVPVFDPALDYLLWRGRNKQLDWPEIVAQPVSLDPAGRELMRKVLQIHTWKLRLSAAEKNDLLENLATRLGFDYDAFRQSRVLSLINEDEERQLAAAGADIQLHTHRHRNPAHQSGFSREIVDNRDCMAALGLHPEHFGYPNGVRGTRDPQWLRELGIKSAAACHAGLVTPDSDFHSLPRVVDCFPFGETEFQAWVYGSAAMLPRRGKTKLREQVPDEAAEELLSVPPAINR
jgi:peptidoglycan/xylan/chitin deacetylase (PgdA/CDA1 family)